MIRSIILSSSFQTDKRFGMIGYEMKHKIIMSRKKYVIPAGLLEDSKGQHCSDYHQRTSKKSLYLLGMTVFHA